jgi:hypothetical protein
MLLQMYHRHKLLDLNFLMVLNFTYFLLIPRDKFSAQITMARAVLPQPSTEGQTAAEQSQTKCY